ASPHESPYILWVIEIALERWEREAMMNLACEFAYGGALGFEGASALVASSTSSILIKASSCSILSSLMRYGSQPSFWITVNRSNVQQTRMAARFIQPIISSDSSYSWTRLGNRQIGS